MYQSSVIELSHFDDYMALTKCAKGWVILYKLCYFLNDAHSFNPLLFPLPLSLIAQMCLRSRVVRLDKELHMYLMLPFNGI